MFASAVVSAVVGLLLHGASAAAIRASASSPPIFTSRFTSRPVEEDLLGFVEVCESSISCAGVSLDPGGTIADGARLYRHSYVGPYRTASTYETRKKQFTYHRGEVRISSAREEVIETRDDVTVAQAKDRCGSLLPDCVAFTYPVRSLKNLDRPANVTFVSEVKVFYPSEKDEWRTYVNNDPAREGRVRDPNQLRYDGQVAANPYRTCCDRTDIPAMEEVTKADTLERISCDISREEFFLKYELPRRAVMLVGCDKDWPATREHKWEPKNLAPRFSNTTRWRARLPAAEEEYDEDYNHNARWGDIVEAMLTDKPYYLFDQLYDPEAKSIEDDYEDPKPMQGGDLYRKLSYFNGPLRWFNVGPAGTGTTGHMDPHATDAWNTLIKGHKWWVIYPEGFTDESQLECDESCSVETPVSSHWYASIGISAARSEYTVTPSGGGYGRHVLQKAGETIYVPDGLIHSVYNYDEVIAITRNYASAANLDDVWRETVTFGSADKWRSMYYHTLNRAQRRRVRKSKYWPPHRWEAEEEDGDCEVGEWEDEMTLYPMREHDPEWVPEVGDLVEAEYSVDSDEEGDGEEYEEFWAMARVLEVQDGLANIEFLLDEQPNEGKGYHFHFLRPLPKEGDFVEAQYGGESNEWYMATVTKAHSNATWDVKYEVDGETDLGLTRVSIRAWVAHEEGEMVQMKWTEDGEELWVDSIITGVMREGGKVHVRHFDGEEIKGVDDELVRRVRWEFELDDDVVAMIEDEDGTNEWYTGRVINVRNNGRYDISLDDGDSSECMSWRELRFRWVMEAGSAVYEEDENEAKLTRSNEAGAFRGNDEAEK